MTDKFSGTAYDADVADIGEGATYSTVSSEMTTADRYRIVVMPYATGANASSAGTVTFNLVAKIAGKWSTATFTSVTVTVSGTSEDVAVPVLLDVAGIQALRVASIVNGDATYHITNVNIAFSVAPRN